MRTEAAQPHACLVHSADVAIAAGSSCSKKVLMARRDCDLYDIGRRRLVSELRDRDVDLGVGRARRARGGTAVGGMFRAQPLSGDGLTKLIGLGDRRSGAQRGQGHSQIRTQRVQAPYPRAVTPARGDSGPPPVRPSTVWRARRHDHSRPWSRVGGTP